MKASQLLKTFSQIWEWAATGEYEFSLLQNGAAGRQLFADFIRLMSDIHPMKCFRSTVSRLAIVSSLLISLPVLPQSAAPDAAKGATPATKLSVEVKVVTLPVTV